MLSPTGRGTYHQKRSVHHVRLCSELHGAITDDYQYSRPATATAGHGHGMAETLLLDEMAPLVLYADGDGNAIRFQK
jgi:hypothetical protein